MRSDVVLARLAVLVPILYFGVLIGAALTWPAYSHVTRYASELGGPDAPRPWIFNDGIMAMGVVCVSAAIGIGVATRRAGGNAGFAIASAVCIALFGVAMFLGGRFPMPDERHGAFGLGFAIVPAPLLLALALRGVPRAGALRTMLVASFALMLATTAVMMGAGHLVTRANVGLWQRANALAMFPWLAVAGWSLAAIASERPRV